jgi:hypothetical protein
METVELIAPSDPAPRQPELCTAELAECTCPDFCERDHDND